LDEATQRTSRQRAKSDNNKEIFERFLSKSYENVLVSIGFNREHIMEAIKLLFEEINENAPQQQLEHVLSEPTAITNGTISKLNIPKERELTEDEKANIAFRLQEMKEKGRLLPDSALTTYFGKPAFHSYGNGNV
jgi:hypothetical protein